MASLSTLSSSTGSSKPEKQSGTPASDPSICSTLLIGFYFFPWLVHVKETSCIIQPAFFVPGTAQVSLTFFPVLGTKCSTSSDGVAGSTLSCSPGS